MASYDDKNIQLCIVTMLLKPLGLHQPKPRSINMANRSALLSGKVARAYAFSAGFMPLPPIYGGLATTASNCMPNTSAWRTSGSRSLAAAWA